MCPAKANGLWVGNELKNMNVVCNKLEIEILAARTG